MQKQNSCIVDQMTHIRDSPVSDSILMVVNSKLEEND